MARYVLSQRRAGKFEADEKRAARAAADEAFEALFAPSADVLGEVVPDDEVGRRIVHFAANAGEVAAKAPLCGDDVLVEPEILHFPAPALPADLVRVTARAAPGDVLAGTGTGLDLTVEGDSGPLDGCEMILFLRSSGWLNNRLSATTGPDGRGSFTFDEIWKPSALLALPAGDHWPMLVRGPAPGDVVIAPSLPPLDRSGWWHARVGLADDDDAGAGIRVGVIDTGAGPHPHLAHVENAGAFVDAAHDPAGGVDVESHGTHVLGTIGGRPGGAAGRVAGVAPGAVLLSARVFPDAQRGANQGDIAAAVDHLSKDGRADLLNLSLGAPRPSEIERDAIVDALERGTLCVCAAANSGGPVEYPAAFEEAVAVSALGLEGWGPPGSLTASRYPPEEERYGADGLYLANFSSFGPQLDCAAPGVGIIATVPERFGLTAPYGAMDGTSMASPVACATLAAILSTDRDYATLPRNASRAWHARALLRRACRDVGLRREHQGFGMPTVERFAA